MLTLSARSAWILPSDQYPIGTIGTVKSGPQVIVLSVHDWSMPKWSIISMPMIIP